MLAITGTKVLATYVYLAIGKSHHRIFIAVLFEYILAQILVQKHLLDTYNKVLFISVFHLNIHMMLINITN